MQQVLQPVHPVDVLKAHQAERRQHENSDARPEVAAVHGHAELEHHDPRAPVRARPLRRRQVEAALQWLLQEERSTAGTFLDRKRLNIIESGLQKIQDRQRESH